MTVPAIDPKPMLYNLEALRGICALMVALVHVPWTNHLLFLPVVHNAWLFVDLFFLLSGFIIALNYADEKKEAFQLKGFMVRRFFRLYPLHLLTLVAMLAIDSAREYIVPQITGLDPRGVFGENFKETLALNLLLLQATGLTAKNILNTPSWSISAEFWTYLIFALICKMVANSATRVTIMAIVGLIGAVAIVFLNGENGLATPLQYGWPRCIMSFGGGTVVWLLFSRFRTYPGTRWIHFAYFVIFLSILMVMGIVGRTSPLNFAVLPLFASVIFLFAIDRGSIIKVIMESPPMQAIGRWSYSIYMVHALWTSVFGFVLNRFFSGKTNIIELGNRLDLPLAIGDFVTAVYLVLVMVTAALTYRFIEVPWRRVGRTLVERHLNGTPVVRDTGRSVGGADKA